MVFTRRAACPRQRCQACQTAPLAYPFHIRCLGTLEQYLHGHELLDDDDWPLRCAQAMALTPVLHARKPKSLVDILHISYKKIMNMVSPSTLATTIQKLHDLPPELTENVFSFMLSSPGGCNLFHEDTLDVLDKLRSWLERRHRKIPCEGALFARWEKFE